MMCAGPCLEPSRLRPCLIVSPACNPRLLNLHHQTQHIAVTIGEELDLHTRLLGDLDEDVDVTYTRLRAATKRVRHVIRHSSNWRLGAFVFALIVVLTLVILISLKVIRIFG